MHSIPLPSVWIDIFLLPFVGCDLVMSMRVAWWAHNAGIVPTVGQNECDVSIGEHLDLVDRTPRSNMIRNRTHRKYRRIDVTQ